MANSIIKKTLFRLLYFTVVLLFLSLARGVEACGLWGRRRWKGAIFVSLFLLLFGVGRALLLNLLNKIYKYKEKCLNSCCIFIGSRKVKWSSGYRKIYEFPKTNPNFSFCRLLLLHETLVKPLPELPHGPLSPHPALAPDPPGPPSVNLHPKTRPRIHPQHFHLEKAQLGIKTRERNPLQIKIPLS